MKKLIVIISVLAICLTSFHSMASDIKINDIDSDFFDNPDSHFIEGVPYYAQTGGYHCYYTCCAMVLNYFQRDTSMKEFLFYDGLGYKHRYYPNERLPDEGCYLGDFDFLIDVFNITGEWWYVSDGVSQDESWNLYYNKLKENISNDIPVITRVDPFSMPSLREQFRIPDTLWNALFPGGHHVVVIVGYNESNHTICYNDPNAGYYGDDRFGDHAWMSISDFRNGIEKTVKGWRRYLIFTLKPNGNPLSKKEAFEITFSKNLEKLKGNISAYYNGYNPGYKYYGINASKKLKNDFSDENISETINLYKQFGGTGFNYTFMERMEKLFSVLSPNKPNIFDIFMVGRENAFEYIAAEKNLVAGYLENSEFYPDISVNHSHLLREESEYWEELSDYYKVFLRKGMFLTKLRANIIMNKMEETMEKIILIEQEIINNSLV